VLDGSGKPIAGAIVKHKNKEVARSDERGRFEYTAEPAAREFADLSPVVVTAEGHAPDWITLDNDPQLVFRLPAPMAVRGRVVDLEGKPLARARVTIKAIEADPKGDVKTTLNGMKTEPYMAIQGAKSLHWLGQLGLPSSVDVDAEGRFEVRGVGRGRILVIQVRADGHESTTLRAVADEAFDPKELAGRTLQDLPGSYRRPRPTMVRANFEH